MRESSKQYSLSTLNDIGEKNLRVAAFCRTYKEPDLLRFAWRHYSALVGSYPKWTFVGCYAGQKSINATELLMGGFPQLLDDCYSGKIDLILTKSCSAFKRNVIECLTILRKLKSRTPSIGVYFEDVDFYTLRNDADIMLSLLWTMAEQESENKGNHIGCKFP
jgi:site-specific DNA recombinase